MYLCLNEIMNLRVRTDDDDETYDTYTYIYESYCAKDVCLQCDMN